MKNVRIGIIGVGGIAKSVHIPEIQKSKGGKITAICDIDEQALYDVGEQLGIDENYRFKDYRDLIACDVVDAVEICTPNYLHVPMALDAIHAGKPVNVEKPLSINYLEAKKLEDALAVKSIPNMMCFSYRFKPAVRYAKWILEKGLIGKVLSVNVEYLKSSAFWEGRKLDWRFIKKYAGTGVLGDLGVHLIDMTRFLIGDVESVCATTGIVVKERQRIDSNEMGKVETDDYCNFLANIRGGVAGTFVITRCAIGHNNTIKYDIFGTEGVISFDLNNPEILGVCIGEVDVKSFGMHNVKVPAEFYVTQEQTFIDLVNGKECKYLPTVKDGIECQKILDALLQSSEENRWVAL